MAKIRVDLDTESWEWWDVIMWHLGDDGYGPDRIHLIFCQPTLLYTPTNGWLMTFPTELRARSTALIIASREDVACDLCATCHLSRRTPVIPRYGLHPAYDRRGLTPGYYDPDYEPS